jgi:uncharacterized membrane protein YhaH (DUF805 family)
MASLPTTFSPSGRIAPKPFVLGAIAIYLASFLSQFLLAAPVTARASIIPFVLVHARRLHDAGRPTGPAVALTVLYALAIVLLLLVMVAANAPGPANGADDTPFAGIFQVFLLLFLIGTVLGDPNLGMFGYIVLGVLALVMLPIVIAIVFTVWVGTRPSAPASP